MAAVVGRRLSEVLGLARPAAGIEGCEFLWLGAHGRSCEIDLARGFDREALGLARWCDANFFHSGRNEIQLRVTSDLDYRRGTPCWEAEDWVHIEAVDLLTKLQPLVPYEFHLGGLTRSQFGRG